MIVKKLVRSIHMYSDSTKLEISELVRFSAQLVKAVFAVSTLPILILS